MELSERQKQVLRLAGQGRTDREIAQALGISHKTVEKHLALARARLRATSRTEAVVRALRAELLDGSEPAVGESLPPG